jgi:hypothetical protein
MERLKKLQTEIGYMSVAELVRNIIIEYLKKERGET